MSAHLTEEEQLESLKRWWDENGKSIMAAVVLGTGGYFGFGAWQDSRQLNAEAASSQYEQVVELLAKQDAVSASDRATMGHLAGELKKQHADTVYGIQAAMLLAKQAIEQNELNEAETNLRWVLEQKPAANIELLARVRLARVLSAQGNSDAALETLKVDSEATFASLFAETRGDIYMAIDDSTNAAAAYQQALASLSALDASRAGQIRMKLNSVQSVAASATADEKDA